jgi:hypothetical protein
MAPLQEAVTTATRPIGDFFSGLVHLPSVEKENERLRRANQDLVAQIAAEADKESQIEQLSNLLGLQESLAGLGPRGGIANGLSNFRYTITINKGLGRRRRAGPAGRHRLRAGAHPRREGGRGECDPAEVELIIDRNSVVAGRLSVSHETGQIQGRVTKTCG